MRGFFNYTFLKTHVSQSYPSTIDLHHIAIKDLEAPTYGQVEELAQIIEQARIKKDITAIHCLAGIGRTSTMLMAAHLQLGESFSGLKKILAERNPTYILTGKQGDFISDLLKKNCR